MKLYDTRRTPQDVFGAVDHMPFRDSQPNVWYPIRLVLILKAKMIVSDLSNFDKTDGLSSW